MIIRPYRQTDRRVRLSGSRDVERSQHSRTLNRLFSFLLACSVLLGRRAEYARTA